MFSKMRFLSSVLIIFKYLQLNSILCDNHEYDKVNTEVSPGISNRSSTTPNNSNLISHEFTPKDRQRLPIRKWQVGRVSRKHYEIINMLWSKTKMFNNIETSTLENRFRRNNPPMNTKLEINSFTPFRSYLQSSTPSYIEFYYLDENDERVKRTNSVVHNKNWSNLTRGNMHYPVLSFHVNDNESILNFDRLAQAKIKKSFKNKPFDFVMGKIKPKTIIFNTTNNIYKNLNNKTSPTNKLCRSCSKVKAKSLPSTTPYDKVKFFELYDMHTHGLNETYSNEDLLMYMTAENITDYVDRVQLQDIDINNIGHHEGNHGKIVKKHNMKEKVNNTNISTDFNANHTKRVPSSTEDILSIMPDKVHHFSSLALWSDYPFAAAYIYEPSQIHCDAAALSPRWLVAAGSCLSNFDHRHTMVGGRSAFVTYCGEHWWQPERISYVKYTILHPNYQQNDFLRKHFYNIGLIQVVGSMASACNAWAPISLMSHNFATYVEGSPVTAVGWGLDRYYAMYSSSELPKKSLSTYKELAYSGSCPGNVGYSKIRKLSEKVAKNVYCLRLPLYLREDTDPVHGSLLLSGGKLMALYLQEERRPVGEQSAQYTAIWRHIPWILDTAREPQDEDSFEIDII